uniref:UHRF1-binding protein 1-like n=2 Tax=Cacopsylla melanoneura TaxID=428564 RepID=A0A8D8ST28_9HEMI
MVSIIKNQILKHLEKFAKNLSVENINISTFKGEGELNSLELNEIVLTDLLELPTWMKMTSATVNRVKFKIPFTKIKSVPIEFNLDDVQIEVETCEIIRSMSMEGGLSAYSQPSTYNAISKIVDGITVNINSVTLRFMSPVFTASVHLLRVKVESKSPVWKPAPLKDTLLKNKAKTQVLIFKELTWDTVKIEARSTMDKSLPPLRLLTNQAKCRITIKKRISDSYVLGSRLALILDDLLWVLTDSQLTAALHFLDSLSGLVQQSNELSRRMKAARKLEELPEYQAQVAQQQVNPLKDKEEKERPTAFNKHDVLETSYHIFCKMFDIHLSDDPGAGRSIHPELTQGGAWQIKLMSLRFHFYPYHLASSNRQHWWKYTDTTPHYTWLTQAQTGFKSRLIDVIERVQNSPSHVTGYPSQSCSTNTGSTAEAPQRSFSTPVKDRLISQLSKLMSTCAVIQIGDFSLFRVTTNERHVSHEFIRGSRHRILASGDKSRQSVPGGDILLHAEFTYYYYPGDIKFPLPSPKFYVQLNPIQIVFDFITLLWLNAFTLNLHRNLMSTQAVTQVSSSNDESSMIYFDVKIEAIMMKVILETSTDSELPSGPPNRDRPRSLHGFVSRATLTNTRSTEWGCSRADLAKCIHACQLGSLFYASGFPATTSDFRLVTEKFSKHAEGSDNVRPDASEMSVDELPPNISDILSQELLWTDSKDVWCIKLDPIWAEFYTSLTATPQSSVPFLDNFPLTIWAHAKPMLGSNTTDPTPSPANARQADVHAIASVSNLISVQINHYQVLFLLRLAEEISELVTFLSMDAQNISGPSTSETSLVLGALIPQLELTCVMPLSSGGKESSGIDVDSSVLPDSSSLVTAGGGSVQWNPVLATHIPDIPESFPSSHTPTTQANTKLPSDISPNPPRPHGQQNGLLGSLDISPSPLHTTPISLKEVKKGFTELFTSFKSPVAVAVGDDFSDSLSIRSDYSDGSDGVDALAVDSDDNDSLFGATGVVNGVKLKTDLALEAFPEDEPPVTPATTTCSERDSIASSCKRKDLISVVTFKLGRVEFVQQSEGFSSSIKLQVTSIANEECSSIPWDEFQAKFGLRSRGWEELDMDGLEDGIDPRVKLRFDHVLHPQEPSTWQRRNPGLWFQDFLAVKLSNVDLKIGLDAVTGLAELLEDEIQQMPLPVDISLDNINVHLSADDKVPPIPPIIACIDRLKLRRGLDGKIIVEPNLTPCMPPSLSTSQVSSSSTTEQRSSVVELKQENEQLRRRLIAMEKLNEENHQLRKLQEESQKLRSYLNSSQEEVFKLEEENRNLLKRIKEFKSEAMISEGR